MTGGWRGLQGVTAAYIRLQRLLKDYRRLVFYLERSQILFLGLFCIVLTKTTTNPLERFYCCVFHEKMIL